MNVTIKIQGKPTTFTLEEVAAMREFVAGARGASSRPVRITQQTLDLIDAELECVRLRAALQFYADEKHVEGFDGGARVLDWGQVARAALMQNEQINPEDAA